LVPFKDASQVSRLRRQMRLSELCVRFERASIKSRYRWFLLQWRERFERYIITDGEYVE
jgi:hypothetical protein